MLNLSDIRKKAGKKGKKGVTPEKPETAKTPEPEQVEPQVQAPEQAEPAEPAEPESEAPAEKVPAETEMAPAAASPEPDQPPFPEAEENARADRSVEPAVQPRSEPPATDPLEALFSDNPELDLATEEAYFEGLVGHSEEAQEELVQFLSFTLGDEEYAVNIQDVQEIIKLREMTDIPRVPSFVLGIISLRGNIIPVFDLKSRLQLGTVEPTDSTRIVVCRDGSKSVGLVVDKINQVVRLPHTAIEQVSGLLSGVNRDLVEGVGRHQGRMLILLDLPSVLAVESS